ncbi:MAG TPA: DUF6132 family protein [Anaerolineae bacterium]|nr:DUF6132 family protein [Anaerolineae bacterium]
MVRVVLGSIAGALVGFAYYKFIGCSGGRCPITSNPWASVLYGAIMGYMIATIGVSR